MTTRSRPAHRCPSLLHWPRGARWLLSAAMASGLSVAGCSSLTEPPAPEPASSESPAAMHASAVASASAPPAQSAAPEPSVPAPPPPPDEKVSVTTLKQGKGLAAKFRDRVSMHYVGTFLDGKKFDSSRDRKQPFDFVLGAGQVIRGWDQGIVGMKVGEKRKLVIPPSLAYGPQGRPGIPPNSTLVFEVELVTLTPGAVNQ